MNKNLLFRETTADKVVYRGTNSVRSLLRGSIALLGYLCIVTIAMNQVAAQVKLVKDISQVSGIENFTEMVSYNGKAYTVTHHESEWPASEQLWVSDGSYEGTMLVIQLHHIRNLTVIGSYLYFTASEFIPDCELGSDDCIYTDHGSELWRSDGTATGTHLFKDIYPGTNGSDPGQLRRMNGTLYFVANDGLTGKELWRSDGTDAGTVVVKDILRVSGSSNPSSLVVLNNQLYFSASDGQTGYELWRSDGTSAGTSLVVDIAPGLKVSSNPQQIVNANGMLFFFASNVVNGRQLWKSTGQNNNATLVKIIRPGQNNKLDLLTSVSSLVFFQADDGIHGVEIWTSDGTSAGTALLKDLTPGPGSASGYVTPHLTGLQSANGKLFFSAFTGSTNLWTSDGTPEGTRQLTTFDQIMFGWHYASITAFKGEAYFRGSVLTPINGNYDYSSELWKTNGTPEGTVKVKGDINDGDAYNDILTAVVGDYLFFTGYDAIWKSDGTPAMTEKIKGLDPPASSAPSDLTDVNGKLFFDALTDYHKLWRSEGTDETTANLHNYFRRVSELKNINGQAYYAAYDHRHGEPWKSDGTSQGTTIIKDIAEDPTGVGTRGSDPSEFTFFNGLTYFRAAGSSTQPYDLWKTDGTDAGTVTMKDVNRENSINPNTLTVVGKKLFFLGENSRTGMELWVTDGTMSGTNLMKDIKPGIENSGAIRFTPFKNLLFFQADDGVQGYELWRTDGTGGGTFRVKNIRVNDQGSPSQLAPLDMGNMMATTNYLYFTAITGSGKNGLWKSNGTYDGTTLVKVFAGQPEADILAAVGDKIIYALSYGTYVELWSSDGTLEETILIKSTPDIHSIKHPYQVTTLHGVVYFLGNDAQQARIWRTDGTPSGTYPIIFKGIPYELEASGEIIYLSADTERWGWELLRIDDATTTIASVGRVSHTEESIAEEIFSSSYPNPFTSEFTLRVNGNNRELFEMNVMSMDGRRFRYVLEYNTDHILGLTWPPGLYVLQIFNGDKHAIHKVIKR